MPQLHFFFFLHGCLWRFTFIRKQCPVLPPQTLIAIRITRPQVLGHTVNCSSRCILDTLVGSHECDAPYLTSPPNPIGLVHDVLDVIQQTVTPLFSNLSNSVKINRWILHSFCGYVVFNFLLQIIFSSELFQLILRAKMLSQNSHLWLSLLLEPPFPASIWNSVNVERTEKAYVFFP